MLQKHPLDALARQLLTNEELSRYYHDYEALLVPGLEDLGRTGIMLDLEALPTSPLPLKKIFLMWLMAVNRGRIDKLQQPIITYELVMQCPIWKYFAPPFRRISMTRDGILNAQAAKSINQQGKARGINRSRR